MTSLNKVSIFKKVPLAFWVIGALLIGFAVGWLYPKNPFVHFLYVVGTYFPKAVVTFAGFLIFNLLGGASAKLVLFHSKKAGKLFGAMFGLYVLLALFSLFWVSGWLPFLTYLPIHLPGVALPSPLAWVSGTLQTFK